MTLRYEFLIHGRPLLEKPYHLTGIGLPNVYLLNGVTIEENDDYGTLVTIDRINELHSVIGRSIIRSPHELTGEEMRFLRKQIGLTQTQLAKKFRVSNQTVANYEKGKTEKGPADMAMRCIYLAHISTDQDIADELRQMASYLVEVAGEPRSRSPSRKNGHWSGLASENHAG